jgi:hypothetical protein
MTKAIEIQLLPRLSLQVATADEYGVFEHELLAKACAYGIEVPYMSRLNPLRVDFAELEYLVDQYEALGEDMKPIAEQAHSYCIPIKECHLGNIISLVHEVEDYEELLTRAKESQIDWDMSIYDPVGLESAIEEAISYY